MSILEVLSAHLPPPTPPLPEPSISLARVTELPIGLGNRRGNATRGRFTVVALKGGRQDALVRFEVWGNDPAQAGQAIQTLHDSINQAREDLWAAGFLRIKLARTTLATLVDGPDAWRQIADYQVLFEFHTEDTDGAESLIARIPIHANPELAATPGPRETTVVTDEMVRWDNEGAALLVVRGRTSVGAFSALTFLPGAPPTGSVALRRTFAGATGVPAPFGSLDAFLAAVAGPTPTVRHGEVLFPSLAAFLAEFDADGDPVTLGNWDEDDTLDSYVPRALRLEPAIELTSVADRLELAYLGTAFDQVSVSYFRATRL